MLDCQIDYQNAQFKLQLQLACAEQIVGILGPSGSGKTSFLHLLAGLLRPQQGPDCAESPFTARYPAAGVCARAST